MMKQLGSSRLRHVVVLASCACALFAGLVVAAPQMIPYTTQHYIVGTDISPRFAQVIANHMEIIYREYQRRFEGFGEMTERFNVKVFRTQAGYAQAVPRSVRGSTGVFVSGDKLLAAHAEGRTAEEVLRTLYHEGFHQFMFHVISKRCPIWLNEGLAEYFSEATWNGQGFTTGQVPTLRLYVVKQAITRGNHIRFASLFAMDPDQWLQNVRTDARRADIQYSQAWSIVQFLLHAENGRYAPMVSTFLKEISEGTSQEEAFQTSFGTDIAAFERSWAQYVISLSPSPKFACRDRMESLMILAKLHHDDVRDFKSVSDLRSKVVQRPRYRWTITRPTGERLSSSNKEEVAKLFRCPFDRGNHEVSYLVARSPQNGEPVLVCTHHPGIIIKAYYQANRTGELRVVMEEEVRETVREDLRQAIMAGSR